MTRQIKFRAWDDEKKEMIAVQGLTFEYQNKPTVIENIGEEFKQDVGWLPVMQFTGLLDKNGKEIYEGDVVRFRFEDYEEWTNYQVVWRDAGFSANEIGETHHFTLFSSAAFEIIGNIYENPELLKV